MRFKGLVIFLLVHTICYGQLNIPCNNWLNLPSYQSYVRVGDLDVPGNTITVEAIFSRTAPYSNGYNWAGDLVSKHVDPSDANYLLRPNNAEITTSNGFFTTPPICEIQLNKVYHAAMVYDGNTLKFYRNGFLMSSVPATGTLFQNNHQTRIGLYDALVHNTNLIGYINEVRIWNVVRSQSQIRAFMNTSLTNPTTQTGLLAYYTFDNLLNKQGNTAWNGTLGGSATINATIPTCNFVADSCAIPPCSNWLSTPSASSYARIGDLDVPGNRITVEATINRTQTYLPGGGNNTEGDVVSKHTDPNDVNYLLRPNHAYITTTNGFFATPDICDIELNKNYHVAMVYDGAFLKFYRNGFLMSQVPATGNLIQNNFNTQIGRYDATVWNTQFLGYINEVRIWNVARTQAEIRTYMNSSLPTPPTQPGLLAYYIFDNLLNKQGNPVWNGTLSGAAAINSVNPVCSFIEDSCFIESCSPKGDFIFRTYVCNPLNISFLTNSTSYNSIEWDFGDGNSITGTSTPSHIYSSTGNYLVRMIQRYPTCNDTVLKQIAVNIQNDNQVILTSDTTICFGTTKQLRTSTSLGFCWTPATYLDNPNSANPITSTPRNITYYYTAEIPGTNIISNGNFNAGNTGFTSAYNYATPNVTEGQYYVGTSPQAWNASLSNCGDHTGGNGNMMLINGAPTPDVKVWSQTVTVTPNTNYAFSTWIQALWPPNPAQLRFSINDNDVGTLITASLPTCTWTQFYTTWNSGNNTTANISIVNKNTQVIGNDFALDDISFAPVLIKRDSVKIIVDTPLVVATNSTAICEGRSVQLNATGAATYSWTQGATLSDPAIANPIATPTGTTRYIVTGTTLAGCEAKDTVDITVNPKPIIIKSANDTICAPNSIRLSASGGVAYSWLPAASLDNPASATPLATPASTTNYIVTVTGANTCTNTDSVKIDVRSPNSFSINPPGQVCINAPIQLVAGGGDIYLWQTNPTLSSTSIPNPTAIPTATTTYTVFITDTLCNNSTTLSTIITALPLPTIRTSKSNDINCVLLQSKLAATGAATYTWSPAATLNTTTGATPVASPTVTTQYVVSGTNSNGCTNKDSVTVNVTKDNLVNYQMPTGFTPNNDGLNDCYGIKYWGNVSEIDFSIYNRWGERVFYSTKVGDCWNGIYKGVIQETGVFVYVIKANTACDPAVFKKGTFILIR